jgi:transposase
MARISPFFPLAHGVPRVDDRRVVSGIVYVIRNGLQWKDAPNGYGPHKTLYNRFMRWSRLGVFDRIFAALAGQGSRPEGSVVNFVFGLGNMGKKEISHGPTQGTPDPRWHPRPAVRRR